MTLGEKKKSGTTIRFQSSAAADVTFVFKRTAAGKKARAVGGFLYAAEAGKNSIKFTGVLRKDHPLRPGTYAVTASGGGKGSERFELTVLKG